MPYTKKNQHRYIQDLIEEILMLKKRRNAVIVAHNYQRKEVQDIADVMGDSLGLSKALQKVDSEIIVFCGVHFMAESAFILNPEKTVLLPVKEAGCPMADMVTVHALKKFKKNYPDTAVITYVNSSAAVKAESDVCCTSSNAVEIVKSVKKKRIIFIPDKNLGNYVGLNVPDKEIILWTGYCPTHVRLLKEQVEEKKRIFPESEFLAHPECYPQVVKIADVICSTGGMLKYVKASSRKVFLIGTEKGLVHRLKKENPDKKFIIPSEDLICPNMKLITLDKILKSLKNMQYKITVDEDIRRRALKAFHKMLEISR